MSAAAARREAMLERIAQLRALEDRAAARSAGAKAVFDKRGQLLPRERVALLLDPGAPFLPLCTLAGYLQDTKDAAASIPGGGVVADSTPEGEYEETRQKARALFRAAEEAVRFAGRKG